MLCGFFSVARPGSSRAVTLATADGLTFDYDDLATVMPLLGEMNPAAGLAWERTLGWLDRHAAASSGPAGRPGLKRKP